MPLAECCVESGGVGARVELSGPGGPDDQFLLVRALFGEAPSRVVVSALPGTRDRLLARARALSVPATVIGHTGGERLTISVAGAGVADIGLVEAEQAWANGLTRYFESAVA